MDNTQHAVEPAAGQSSTSTAVVASNGNAGGMQTSAEPINLVTDDYLNDVTDLAVGSRGFPVGLAFHRHYDSGTRLRSGVLGPGWAHNFAITAATDSDGFAGLAANSPISGAAAIAATFVTFDLFNGSSSLERLLIACVLQRWLMEQLTGNIAAVTQPGYVEHFTKLADGSYNPPPGSATVLSLNGSTFQYVTKDQQRLSFGSTGNLQTWTMPSGAAITLTYSGTPEVLSTISNNLGRTLSLSYTSGLLSQVSDGTGRSVSYSYDSSSNLVGVTDPLGNRTTYAYDLPGRLTQIFNPANPGSAIVTNTYDTLGRIRTQSSSTNPPWQYFFAGTRSEEDDPFGSQHVIYATPHGKTRVEIQDLQGLHLVTNNAFDALDRLITTTTPEGKSAGYSYDTKSNVLTVTVTPKPGSPLSAQVTTFTYDPVFNKPTSITDPLGLVTSMTYAGGTGNLISAIADFGSGAHLNARQSFTYDGFGQVLTAMDPLGTVTQFSYDGFGNQTRVVRDVGSGRLNQQISFGYNTQGDVISTIDPRGNTTTGAFDANRRPTSITAPSGVVTSYSYDANGQVIQTRQSMGGAVLRSTSATYSVTSKPVTATDANGSTTTFAYDARDRLSQTTDPLGRVTITGYDALSRQKSISNPAIAATPLLQQAYTPDGQLASLTDANSNATTFAYDGLDRLATTSYPLGSTETYTYDADNNVLTRKTRANQTVTFTYDTLNRLKTKTPPSPAPVVTYGYDLAGRLTSVSDTSAAITAAVPPSGSLVQYATSYAYDAMNRPTAVSWTPAPTQAATTASSVTFGHSYNRANQRIGQTATDNTWLNYPAATPGTTSYTANALNQYTAVGAVTPSYDGNGSLTSDGTFTLGYDAENRLVSASGAGNSAAYTFDAQGRRKTKAVNGSTTVFVTDADNREVLEYDGATGAVLRWYSYGLGPNAVLNQMNVLASTRATLVPDLLGSVVGTLDSASASLTKVGYLPFGQSGSAGPFGFTGQPIDLETGGLYYYRARHYSPAWGRFLQTDPIGPKGGINLYAYVGNDPVNGIDPMGTSGVVINWGVGAFVGTGGNIATVTNISTGDSYGVKSVMATASANAGLFWGSGVNGGLTYTYGIGAYGQGPTGATGTLASNPGGTAGDSNGALGFNYGKGFSISYTTAQTSNDTLGVSTVRESDWGVVSITKATGTGSDGQPVTTWSIAPTVGWGSADYIVNTAPIVASGMAGK